MLVDVHGLKSVFIVRVQFCIKFPYWSTRTIDRGFFIIDILLTINREKLVGQS